MDARNGVQGCSISVSRLWVSLALGFVLVGCSDIQEQAPISHLTVQGDFAREVLERKEGANYCKPEGLIKDSCCDFKTVDDLNQEILPDLNKLLETPFFSHFKLNLHKTCPFWNANELCSKIDCKVSTLDRSEVPEPWLSDDPLGSIDFDPIPFGSKKTERCTFTDKDFCVLEDEESLDGEYVNLLKNPERFTGYAGDSAAKVWRSIYEENCFGILNNLNGDNLFLNSDNTNNVCSEKRIFYRIVSGLHASISTHICDQYFNSTSGQWERNLECFVSRVGSFPDRLENMYFDYVILLRAITKVSRYLKNYSYCGSEPEQDKLIKKHLARISKTTRSCPDTFDEKALFQGDDAKSLKTQFKEHFRNITRVMDCIGCQKCRLWGKIQTGGNLFVIAVLMR
ncbi:endoplasmic oxidoreductin-1 [Entomophthora muscae]|uniref:Endoplasmic oxidoreductin-1 n=1 Tax=Entomophthora muscae TaxID=34485 RepID=A0ACC2TW87_9FUNG|nr:endoplasmic oxidoreductin-1 [Entomophthora muscae]